MLSQTERHKPAQSFIWSPMILKKSHFKLLRAGSSLIVGVGYYSCTRNLCVNTMPQPSGKLVNAYESLIGLFVDMQDV